MKKVKLALFVVLFAVLGACASVPTGTSSSAQADESDSPSIRDKIVEKFKTQIRSSVSPFAAILSALEPKTTLASSSKDEDANVRVLKSIEAGTGLMTFSDCKSSTTRTGSNIVTKSTCTVSTKQACTPTKPSSEFSKSINIDRLSKASCETVAVGSIAATKQNLY